MFACNGILFNHESPLRGETFVTRKITRAAARIALGLQQTLYLGNLDAKRDWGHARDYIKAQWLMLQQKTPDDFVIASGEQHSVREFCEIAFKEVGIELAWEGQGIEEKAVVTELRHSHLMKKYENHQQQRPKQSTTLIEVDPAYFRPTEVKTLLGDATKARQKLGWKPETGFREMVREMIAADLAEAAMEVTCKSNGYLVQDSCEAAM